MNVGISGSGTLNVLDGGQVSTTNGADGNIAVNSGSTGTATVSGSDSQWNNSGSLYVGGSAGGAGGSGSLTVADSGSVSVAETTKLWSGGSISLNSGGILDTQTLDLTAGSFEMLNGGTLHADVVIGDLANSSGVLAPGHSPGVMTINGNYTQESLATLEIELGAATPGMFDQLVVTGDLSPGGLLQVSLIDDFAPAAGDTFDILDWGTLAGAEFDAIELPELAGRIAWSTSGLYTDGVIEVVGMLDGDTDVDWDVDTDDYNNFVAEFGGAGDWHTDFNEDGMVDLTDFTLMRANFGMVVDLAPTPVAPVATPEPATMILLVLDGLVALPRGNRRNRDR